MTTILTKIQRKILQGDYDIKEHCLFELAKDGLTIKDAFSAILKAERCIKLTDNESHVRYEILGFTKKRQTDDSSCFYFARNSLS